MSQIALPLPAGGLGPRRIVVRNANATALEACTAAATSDGTAGQGRPGAAPAAPLVLSTFTVQFASPDAGAVDAALAAVRGAPGVQGAATTSLAMGGTSVMRVTSASDIGALADALRARGWRVTVGANALSIRR